MARRGILFCTGLMGSPRDEARQVHRDVELRSGHRVVVRSLQPEDEADLAAMFDRLSGTSRYQRFLGGKPQISPRALRRLVEVDHRDHEALVAVSTDGAGEAVVGEARYIRDEGDPTEAEMAITVDDDWQGLGLGTTLARDLAHRAAAEGIDRFSAEILADNAAIRELVEHIGDVEAGAPSEGVAVLHVTTSEVGDDPAAEGALRRVLRAAGRGTFLVLPRPLRWGVRLSGRLTRTLLVPVDVLLGRR